MTRFMPLVSFSNSWKHQKTSDVSRGYRNKPMAWNGLDTKYSYTMVYKILEHLSGFLEGITWRTDDAAKLKICIFTHCRYWSENLENLEEYFLCYSYFNREFSSRLYIVYKIVLADMYLWGVFVFSRFFISKICI